MATAGRILIIPKGEYKSDVTYENLDMVFYDGASWVAKKMVSGIAPSDDSEYWYRATGELPDHSLTIDKMAIGTLGYVTPEMYGAVGDGVTDDTLAFQNAINENKKLIIPNGDYFVTNLNVGDCEIVGLNDANIKVSGAITIVNTYCPKISNVTFTAIGSNRECLMCISDNSYYGDFRNITFANQTNAVNVAVKVDGTNKCHYMVFSNCVFSNFELGVYLYNSANSNHINDSVFYLCNTCVELNGSEGNRITNNTFQTFKVSAIKLYTTNDFVCKARANLITGNYFEGDNTVSYVGDIDLCGDKTSVNNTILGNHYTFIKLMSHVVNDSANGNNNILDYCEFEYDKPNQMQGFMKNQVMPEEFKVYSGSDFLGTIAPFEDSKGNVDYYIHSNADGMYGWKRIITTGYHTEEPIDMPPIELKSIHQYYNGYIQLGYDSDTTLSNAITIDTNQQLIKRYNSTSGKWEYLQKVESGSTTNRPTWKPQGYMYFDNTLMKPIWSNGSNKWVDCNGTSV